jgi:hypothetical protein
VERTLISENPPLKFMSASRSLKDNADGGKDQIHQWTRKLSEISHSRFRGLVDREKSETGTDAVSVLNRHSIENYLFDPLTVAAYLVHRGVTFPFANSDNTPRNPTDFLSSD